MSNTSNTLGVDNPRVVTGSYRGVSAAVGAGARDHPDPGGLIRAICRAGIALEGLSGLGGWLTGLPRRIGGRLFAGNDEEAGWRGWTAEPRRAGLSRAYRDPMFDRLVRCPDCHGAGITRAESRCVPCAGTGRLVLGHPPIAHDG